MAEKYETSTMSTSDTRNEPTDTNMDNLARQGLEDPNSYWDPIGILFNGNLR